jgi:hypothetical protein
MGVASRGDFGGGSCPCIGLTHPKRVSGVLHSEHNTRLFAAVSSLRLFFGSAWPDKDRSPGRLARPYWNIRHCLAVIIAIHIASFPKTMSLTAAASQLITAVLRSLCAFGWIDGRLAPHATDGTELALFDGECRLARFPNQSRPQGDEL